MTPVSNPIAEAARLLVETDFDRILDDCWTPDGRFELARLIPAMQRRLPPLSEDELLQACEIAAELLKADAAFTGGQSQWRSS